MGDLKKEIARRNFIGGVFHGTFFAGSQTFAEPTTILPAYVALLSGSELLVGLMATLLLTGEFLPQLFFSHQVEKSPRKKPYLIFAVYSRAVSWIALGVGTAYLGPERPSLLLILLFASLFSFSVGGSLGGVAYMDIIGSTITRSIRGRFFAMRQLLGGLTAFGTSFLVGSIIGEAGTADRYALLFTLSGAALAVAGLGLLALKEVPRPTQSGTSWREYLRDLPNLWRSDAALRQLVMVENLAGFHLMILPFYVVYGRRLADSPEAAMGQFVMFQVLGGAVSNVLWGKLSDTCGSPAVLRICVGLGAALPLLALALGTWAPAYYALIFLFVGAAVNSRNLSFSNVLVDIAPDHRRPTYTGMTGTLTAPRLLFPFLGGALIPVFGLRPVFFAVSLVLAATLVFLSRYRVLDESLKDRSHPMWD